MVRKALVVAAGLITLALAQPGLAAAAPPVSTRSTVLGGYNFANYIGVPGAVSAVVVVPRLDCKATPGAGRSVYAGVGIQSVNSYARLYLACTPPGQARYYPSLLVNGTVENFPGNAARAGDTIEFAVSQSDSQVTVSVIDTTHKFDVTRNGSGSGTGEGITAGDYPVLSGSAASAVPNFGTITFSSAQINGYPFGSATGLQIDDLYGGSSGELQIKTTYSAGNKESFATVFKHS